MQPFLPRKQVNDQMMCPMCADNEGFRTMGQTRVAVRHHQGELDRRTSTPEQGIKYFIAQDMPRIVRIAHDSGDSITVFHCPFCGSGQVIARSDGSIECEFCHSSFTVQVQPEFSAFPQTIGGVPVDVPGMGPDQQPMDAPGDEQDMGGPQDPMAAGAQTAGADGEFPPEEEDEEDPEAEEEENPFAKKSYRTADGRELDEESYLQHLALATTRDRTSILRRVRAANGMVSGK